MIIQCRPSQSPPKYLVKWRKRIGFKEYEIMKKEYNTFADANGFLLSLQKRGVFVFPLVRK